MTNEKILNLAFNEKIDLIQKGEYLDILIRDESELVRMEVARHGFGLDILINDESELVRMEIVAWLMVYKIYSTDN